MLDVKQLVEEIRANANRARSSDADAGMPDLDQLIGNHALVARQAKLVHEIESCRRAIDALAELPQGPPTPRAKLGRGLCWLVRRALFWHIPRVQEILRLQLHLLDEFSVLLVAPGMAARQPAGSRLPAESAGPRHLSGG